MLFTVGHSTRSLEEFLAVLKAFQINRLVDVRTVPRSRTNPQFNRETLPAELERQAIQYAHDPRLGGLRRPHRDSVNTGWKNQSFRGYADHMSTTEFQAALEGLEKSAANERVAIMCAEAVPWRCHRSLIADALSARGISVAHIMSEKAFRPHKTTSFARVDGGKVSYPGFFPDPPPVP